MPVPSLVDLCTKACIKNIRSLTDVGAFEYWKIKPVLQRIESPEQLHQIEVNSPHIRGEDAELWKAFIARDIPNWRTKNYAPKNPLKWYEVYCKYKKEQTEEIKRDEDILRNTMMGLNNHKATHVSKVVDLKSLPKLPKDPRMIANNGGVPLKGRGFKKEAASSLMFSAGSRTKITDGQSVLTKARREAKEISAMGKLARPTHQLSGKIGQVKKAPAGMATEYKIANQPAIKILSKGRKRFPLGQFEGGISGPSLEEREKRLRAMQSRPAARTEPSAMAANETLVGSSDDEGDDLFDDDDDGGNEPQYRAPAKPSRPVSSSSASRPSSSRPHQTSSPPARPSARPAEILRQNPGSSASAPSSRTASPAPGASRPMMPKRRAEVDVFNRGSKKPRIR